MQLNLSFLGFHKKIIIKMVGDKNNQKEKLKNSASVACKYDIQGQNNKIIIVNEDGTEKVLTKNETIPGLKLKIIGNNNILKFSSLAKFIDETIDIKTSDNLIEIGNVQSIIGCISIWNGNQQKFIWHSGPGSLRFARFFLCQENSSLEIDKECLLSDVTVWTSDVHPLIDLNTDKVLNDEASHMIIGKNSWIATECILLKNAQIPEGSVVGARSVVTKAFTEKNTIIAGNPAKVIKKNINWKVNF